MTIDRKQESKDKARDDSLSDKRLLEGAEEHAFYILLLFDNKSWYAYTQYLVALAALRSEFDLTDFIKTTPFGRLLKIGTWAPTEMSIFSLMP